MTKMHGIEMFNFSLNEMKSDDLAVQPIAMRFFVRLFIIYCLVILPFDVACLR